MLIDGIYSRKRQITLKFLISKSKEVSIYDTENSVR